MNLDNTSLEWMNLNPTKEFKLGRKPMDVNSLEKTSLKWLTLESTREFILGRMDLNSVENTFLKMLYVYDLPIW